jgi:hypothetical protein
MNLADYKNLVDGLGILEIEEEENKTVNYIVRKISSDSKFSKKSFFDLKNLTKIKF